jgi:hypothetical protein
MKNRAIAFLKNRNSLPSILVLSAGIFLSPAASAATLRVSIENLAPTAGNFLTPVWVGFHNGGFDIYDRGVSLVGFPGTESVAEDGATEQISAQFTRVGAGSVQATIPGATGPIAPTQTATFDFDLDQVRNSGAFFSYASMIIPSNDAFIANGNPLAHRIFDGSGNFLGADFVVAGSQVLDAGTEVNDELPFSTAFFGQQTPNTGVDQNGVVETHPGFNPRGSGGILDSTRFANADFKAPGYQVARIRVEQVPEPASVLGLLAIGGSLWLKRRSSGSADQCAD